MEAKLIKQMEQELDQMRVCQANLRGIQSRLAGCVPHLNDRQWQALERAESRIYSGTGAQGMHGWTDVMERETDDLPAALWAQAEMAVENDHDVYSASAASKDSLILHRTASRVAQALAILSFGADVLLRS